MWERRIGQKTSGPVLKDVSSIFATSVELAWGTKIVTVGLTILILSFILSGVARARFGVSRSDHRDCALWWLERFSNGSLTVFLSICERLRRRCIDPGAADHRSAVDHPVTGVGVLRNGLEQQKSSKRSASMAAPGKPGVTPQEQNEMISDRRIDCIRSALRTAEIGVGFVNTAALDDVGRLFGHQVAIIRVLSIRQVLSGRLRLCVSLVGSYRSSLIMTIAAADPFVHRRLDVIGIEVPAWDVAELRRATVGKRERRNDRQVRIPPHDGGAE